MHPFAHTTRLRLDIERPRRSFEVLSFKGSEVLSEPYSFDMEIVSPNGPLDAHELLFGAGYLYSPDLPGGFHGHLHSIVRSSSQSCASHPLNTAPTRYLITFGPRLGLMAYRQNRRIFQDLCAEQIVAQLLLEHGIDAQGFQWQRQLPCKVREYCAQYCESDLQLLQRLCREEGMHYHFVHSAERHVVVFTDRLPEQPQHLQSPSVKNSPGMTTCKTLLPPRRPAMQRACVAGRLFALAKPDAKGRIKVRFDWGNQGEGARFNDCWVPLGPRVDQRRSQWWGGMEVVVSFRDGHPERPYISDRLWDPDINPQRCTAPQEPPRRVITTRVDAALLMDDTQEVQINDQLIVRMAQRNEMHFRVGDSQVTIDAKSITLTGLKVMLSSIAQGPGK